MCFLPPAFDTLRAVGGGGAVAGAARAHRDALGRRPVARHRRLDRRVRQVLIAVLAALAVLGQIGVNVTPLLAGAGIVGVAVGFGAQTLVRDIISGVFFLIDDAFRKGEYIDVGTVTGTVEAISIRSMRLRHHNGPLHTIPFGEIRHLTHFSRDWVMMKLPLRVTYDTDVERLRKLIRGWARTCWTTPGSGRSSSSP